MKTDDKTETEKNALKAEGDSVQTVVRPTWLHIDSAPKGVTVDIWVKCLGCEFRATDFILINGEWIEEGTSYPLTKAVLNVDPQATHWMIPPTPPI